MPSLLLPCLPILLPTLVHAGEGWVDLDTAVARLVEPRLQDSGPHVSGFIRVNYASSDDLIVNPATDGELGGFSLDAARLQLEGEVQGWGYFFAADAFTGAFGLLDAYVTIPCTDVITTVVGQYKTPFLRTGLLDFDRTLFIVRTRNGVFYSVRDRGVQVKIDEGAFHAALSAQNGADSIADELLLAGRATWDVGGGLATSGKGDRKAEGAYGAPAELRAEIGVAVQDDGALEDGDALALEGALTVDRLYFHAELLAYGETFDLDTGSGLPIAGSRSDTDPFSLTASYMLDPDAWEVALRHEDFDDDLDRKLTSGGVNHYLQGHDLKLQLNVYHLESDGGDEDTIAAGATISF